VAQSRGGEPDQHPTSLGRVQVDDLQSLPMSRSTAALVFMPPPAAVRGPNAGLGFALAGITGR
jgi:hypothetical protein